MIVGSALLAAAAMILGGTVLIKKTLPRIKSFTLEHE
jgi:hypothetical protein